MPGRIWHHLDKSPEQPFAVLSHSLPGPSASSRGAGGGDTRLLGTLVAFGVMPQALPKLETHEAPPWLHNHRIGWKRALSSPSAFWGSAHCWQGDIQDFLARHQMPRSLPLTFFGMIILQGLLMSGSGCGGGCQNFPAETEAMHPHLAASVFPEESLLPESPQPSACASHGISMAMGRRRTGQQSSTCPNTLLNPSQQGFVRFSLPLPRKD